MSKLAYVTAALLVLPAPALAQIVFDDGPPPAAPAKGTQVKSGVDKLVCRTEATIGSRVQGHQVCMTVAQWEERDKGYKEEAREIQDLANIQATNLTLELQTAPNRSH